MDWYVNVTELVCRFLESSSLLKWLKKWTLLEKWYVRIEMISSLCFSTPGNLGSTLAQVECLKR